MIPIADRQTPVKTLPSLAVGNYYFDMCNSGVFFFLIMFYFCIVRHAKLHDERFQTTILGIQAQKNSKLNLDLQRILRNNTI